MPEEGSEIERLYAQLSKKVDEQARFTRTVTVICTLSILGVLFYTLTSVVATLPDVVLLHVMGNMEKLVSQWKLIESAPSEANQLAKPAPPAAEKK